jgi:iron(III) transport system substrate-binding protein
MLLYCKWFAISPEQEKRLMFRKLQKLQKLIVCAALIALVVSTLLAAAPATAQSKGVVNVYSARNYGAMEGAFAQFTKETGIEVRLSSGSTQALLERLRADGKQSPADVLFVIDVGSLGLAAEENLLQPIESEILTKNIPETARDKDNRWFGLTQRARTIMYNPAKVKPEELSTYEALADEQWKGRLCLRPATHIYTVALVAGMIDAIGEAETEKVVKGWAANTPKANFIDSDEKILQTIAAGGCDVGITNHYYLARLLDKDPAFAVKPFWANQKDRGTTVNLSGAGVTASAVNKENAIKLIEYLRTEAGQANDKTGLPGGNFEYPVNTLVKPHPITATFGEFKPWLLKAEHGKLQKTAITILEKAGYGF